MHAKRGFTLIEILVVIVIIGITIGFALLAFGDFGASRRVIVNAEQLSSYIKLLQQSAILENNNFGIYINNDGYTTYRLEQGQWQPMPTKSIFHPRSFPNTMTVQVQVGSKDKGPDIVVDSSGDLSNFVINLGTDKNPTMARLFNDSDGQLIIQRPKN